MKGVILFLLPHCFLQYVGIIRLYPLVVLLDSSGDFESETLVEVRCAFVVCLDMQVYGLDLLILFAQ